MGSFFHYSFFFGFIFFFLAVFSGLGFLFLCLELKQMSSFTYKGAFVLVANGRDGVVLVPWWAC